MAEQRGTVTVYTKGRIFWLFVAMLFSLQIGFSSAAENNTPIIAGFSGVDFKNGLLKISVENQQFQKVMDEVAQKTGIRIVINDPSEEDFSVHFDYLPVEQGLKKLLRGRNYVLVYSSGESIQAGTVEQILVFPRSEERIGENIKGSTESRSVRGAGQKEPRDKMRNVDQESLDEIFRVLSQSGIDIGEEMVQDIKDLGELGEEFSQAFEMIQKMGGFEQLMNFEAKTEKSLATQPGQKGSGEMRNVDAKTFDEVLKGFLQGEGELNQ